MSIHLITISREFGAGGSELGVLLGRAAGLAGARPRAGPPPGRPAELRGG